MDRRSLMRETTMMAFAMLFASACSRRDRARAPTSAVIELHVAAAASLSGTVEALGEAFARTQAVRIVPIYGATGSLARQIENGLPVDVFLSADTTTPRDLAAHGHLASDTVAPFARGVLVLYSPAERTTPIATLAALTNESVHRIAIANPEHAPFGRAAREALTRTGMWDGLQPRLVTAENVREAFEFARTGNADVALTARSVTVGATGHVVEVDPALYAPIDEALGVAAHAEHPGEARAFCTFVRSPAARAILTAHGFAPIP